MGIRNIIIKFRFLLLSLYAISIFLYWVNGIFKLINVDSGLFKFMMLLYWKKFTNIQLKNLKTKKNKTKISTIKKTKKRVKGYPPKSRVI